MTQPPVFLTVTPSLGGLPTKVEESPLPMRQTSPRRMPTRYFVVSGRASRYYTLLKSDLEVIVAKGNLIIPHRNSTTGCSFMSYPGQHYYYYYVNLLLKSLVDGKPICKVGKPIITNNQRFLVLFLLSTLILSSISWLSLIVWFFAQNGSLTLFRFGP